MMLWMSISQNLIASDKDSFSAYIVVPPSSSNHKTRHKKLVCPKSPGISVCMNRKEFLTYRADRKKLNYLLENPITERENDTYMLFAVGTGALVTGFLLGIIVTN